MDNGEQLYLVPDISIDGSFVHFQDKFFFPMPSEKNQSNYIVNSAYEADIQTGQYNEFYMPPVTAYDADTISDDTTMGAEVKDIVPFTASNETNYLVIVYFAYLKGPVYITDYMHFATLYNYDTKEVIYEHQLPQEPLGPPIIVNDKLYAAGYNLYCIDLFTKEILWNKTTNLRHGVKLVEDSIMVVIRTGIGPEVIAYDTETGMELWRQDATDNNTEFQLLNGVVYYSGTYLYAFDLYTGEMYCRIEGDETRDYVNFNGGCSVIPGKNGEKGRIIASYRSYTFCYEAVK